MDIREILQKEGITEQNALLGQGLLTAYARISHYEAVCRNFQEKYGLPLEEMKRKVELKENEEDFQEEEDLADWEFADVSLKWWIQKVEELHSAA